MAEKSVESSLQLYIHRVTQESSGSFDLHCHSFYEIYYVLSGDVSYIIEGNRFRPQPGSVLLIPAGAFHGVRVESTAPYERYALHFLPELLSPEYREALLAIFRPGGCLLEKPEPSFRTRCDSLLQCDSLPEPLKPCGIKSRLEALLTELCNAESIPTSGALENSRPAGEILSYVNMHLTESLTLAQLCQIFFLSKNHLNRLFRQATGTTVWSYLLHKRAALAQQFLLQGIPAAEAAARSGFQDYSAFYRCYRKIYGAAPSTAHSHGLFAG